MDGKRLLQKPDIENTKLNKHAVYQVLAQLKRLISQEDQGFLIVHSIQSPEHSSAK